MDRNSLKHKPKDGECDGGNQDTSALVKELASGVPSGRVIYRPRVGIPVLGRIIDKV